MSRPAPSRLFVGLGLLALLVPLAPTAPAQVPPLPTSTPEWQVAVAGTPTFFQITTSGGSTSFQFVISFTCYSAQTQKYGACDGNFGDQDMDVTVAEARRPSYPDGWTVTVTGLDLKTMKAKESKSIRVDVHLDRDDPAEDRFPMEIRVTAKPILPGGGLLDPLVKQGNQETSASAIVQVEKALTAAEKITSFARTYMWPLLGMAAVLAISAVILVQRKRAGGIVVRSDAPLQQIVPGRGASFPLQVRNDARDQDRIHLGVTELPPGWVAVVPLSEIDLKSEESTQLWVTVRAPPEATPGQVIRFDFRATSISAAHREASLSLEARVAGEPRIQEEPLAAETNAEAPAVATPAPRRRRAVKDA